MFASLAALAVPPGPIINVRDQGARGDGTTDDRAAIQRGIDRLTAGATLIFPAGRYRLSGPLTNKRSNVAIAGEGGDVTIVAEFPGTRSGDPVFISSGHDAVTIRHLSIVGRHGGGVYLTGGRQCLILRVNVSGATLTNSKRICTGIYVEQVDELTIDSCTLSGNGSTVGEGHGDIICNSGTYRITNSRITNNRCHSSAVNTNIGLFDPGGCLVQGNECAGARVSPVSALRQGYGVLLYHTATGPTAQQVRGCRVLDNVIHDVQGCGIFMQDVSESLVLNNTVRNVGSRQNDASLPVAGIAIEGHGYTCSGNTMTACGPEGIAVSSCRDSSVLSNTISGAPRNGIGIRGPCADVTIAMNRIENPGQSGIGMWSDTHAERIRLLQNEIRVTNGRAHGIRATPATSGWTVRDNIIVGTRDAETLVLGGRNHTSSGNQRRER